MIIDIENSKYEIGNIKLHKRNHSCGEYTLSQISSELLSIIKSSIEGAITYSSIKVTEEKILVLDGEDCFFNTFDELNRTVKLHVGWVN